MKHDSITHLLRTRLAAAVAAVTGQPCAPADTLLRSTNDPKFGDYQCNAAMGLAKQLRQKPRDIAQRIIAAVDLADVAEPLEIAGPGFINIRLKPDFLARFLAEIPAPPADPAADRLGVPRVPAPQKVVIDYSSPNIAKQMHVGHLRSTIIGDVFARVLAFLGHDVIRQNHVGDWGTQFGMLIEHFRTHALPDPSDPDVLEAIEAGYRAAAARFKRDPQFAEAARRAVGELQSGQPQARELWGRICQLSRGAFTAAYTRLGVLLTDADVCGESFYQLERDRLTPVIDELREKLAPERVAGQTPRVECREDAGALCLYFYDEKGQPRFKNPDGAELPMIIRKSDGAFLYATTDLAAIRYRIEELGGRRLIYVTDARQRLHFQMLFAVARAADWACHEVTLEHTTFGSVLGEDRRPLKTREGENVKLAELLDEAEQRALALVKEKQPQRASDEDAATLSDAELRDIARRVGIAAVKYADLVRDRNSDYIFRWDQMLAMQGNTAPYMMYAYARIRSIYRKAAERFGSPDVYAADVEIPVGDPTERALALRLARLPEAIEQVAADLAPHTLCSYLYDLAADFMRFYEACPVLRAENEPTRLARMRLCDLTARTLRLGLGLLGIEVIERM